MNDVTYNYFTHANVQRCMYLLKILSLIVTLDGYTNNFLFSVCLYQGDTCVALENIFHVVLLVMFDNNIDCFAFLLFLFSWFCLLNVFCVCLYYLSQTYCSEFI